MMNSWDEPNVGDEIPPYEPEPKGTDGNEDEDFRKENHLIDEED